jgi:hypothetical protein
MKPLVVEGSASKLFRVLVVGGLSMAGTAACSSSAPPGDDDAAATEDSKPANEAKDAKGEAATDVATQEAASDSAPIPDVTTDTCVPYDGRWDGPDGGFCAHGVCAW